MSKVGGFFNKLFGAGGAIKDFLGGASNIIDNVVTNQEEKNELKNQFSKMTFDFFMSFQEEITERHKNDMGSDSWLSKNIRPLVLIFLLGMYSLLSLIDGNVSDIVINESYVQLLGQWGMLVMSFYFGSRGLEKITNLIGQYNAKKSRK